MSEKKRFWQSPEHMEGFGQAFVVSEYQKLDWADLFFMTVLPKQLRMPHLFPQLPPSFRFSSTYFILCDYIFNIYYLYFSLRNYF